MAGSGINEKGPPTVPQRQHLGPQSLTWADPLLCDGALAGARPAECPPHRSVSTGAFSGLSGSSTPPHPALLSPIPLPELASLCVLPRAGCHGAAPALMALPAGRALQPPRELPTTLCGQPLKTFRACAQPSADYSPRGPPPAAEGAQERVLPADPRPQLPTRTWALAAKPQQHCPLPGAECGACLSAND